MTVSELIEKLHSFAPDLPVVTAGFDESGYEYVETVQAVRIAANVNKGNHSPDFVDSGDRYATPDTDRPAVLINF